MKTYTSNSDNTTVISTILASIGFVFLAAIVLATMVVIPLIPAAKKLGLAVLYTVGGWGVFYFFMFPPPWYLLPANATNLESVATAIWFLFCVGCAIYFMLQNGMWIGHIANFYARLKEEKRSLQNEAFRGNGSLTK